MTETIVRSHPWEIAGLGLAPFSFLGMTENAFRMPNGSSKAGGSCDYCGTGIRYEFHCASSDGRRFKVGCDCIARCHLPAETIVVQATRTLKEHQRKARREKREISRKAEREARQDERAAKREAIKVQLAMDPLYLRITAVVGVATRDCTDTSSFLVDMRDSMERWGALTEKQEAAVRCVLDRMDAEPARKAASYWLGSVGQRVAVQGVVEFTRLIYQGDGSGYDPDRWLNKIRTDDGAVVSWFTTKGLKEGRRVIGTATVKKLDEYQGEKQTLVKNLRERLAA